MSERSGSNGHRLARDLGRRISQASRNHKAQRIAGIVPHHSTVLLVGASTRPGLGTQNRVELSLVATRQVTILVYEETDGFEVPGATIVRGDGTSLPFANRAFDFVVSNAVVEHVGGPGPAQQMMRECLRVSRRAAIHTTPNRWFPVETHTLIPLLHWLPRRSYGACFGRVGHPTFNRQRYWLLSRREFASLTGGPVEGWPRVWPMTLLSVRTDHRVG